MSWLRKLLGPKNSLIFVKDRIANRLVFEEELLSIKKFYSFVPLSELIDEHLKGRAKGLAAFCIPHARKRVVHEFASPLREADVPFTVFVDPDCVGTNRLPVEDELRLLAAQHLPYKKELESLCDLYWEKPEEVEAALALWRKKGPLPLNSLDPLDFFCTWGELLQLGDKCELGLHLTTSPRHTRRLAEGVKFISQRTGRPPIHAYSEFSVEAQAKTLQEAGFRGVVGPARGAVEEQSRALELPQWAP